MELIIFTSLMKTEPTIIFFITGQYTVVLNVDSGLDLDLVSFNMMLYCDCWLL